MTEKRFRIHKNELDFYFDVVDSEKRWEIGDVELDNLPVFEDLVDLLNELAEEKKELQVQCNLLREQANEFHRGARENANRAGQLEKENKELKQFKEQVFHLIDKKLKENERLDGVDTAMYYANKGTLNELKKEII